VVGEDFRQSGHHCLKVMYLLLDDVDVDCREPSSVGALGRVAAPFRPLVLKVCHCLLLPPRVGEASRPNIVAEGPTVAAPMHLAGSEVIGEAPFQGTFLPKLRWTGGRPLLPISLKPRGAWRLALRRQLG
jgi:hypothetical protein